MTLPPRARHRRPGIRQRQDDRGHRADGRTARRGATRSRRTRSARTTSIRPTTRLATGRPGRNLDPVLVGEELDRAALRAWRAGADIAVVEGVMGLFDGRGCDRRGFHRPRRAGCSTPRWSWSSTPRRSRARSRRWCTASRATTRRCASPAWCSTASPPRGTSSCYASRSPPGSTAGIPVLGALPARRGRRRAQPPPRAGAGPGARPAGGRCGGSARRARRATPRRRRPSLALAGHAPTGPTSTPWSAADATVGDHPSAAARWSPSPAARRSPSATPKTAELLAASGAEVAIVDPLQRRATARAAPARWSSAAASPRSTPSSCPRTRRCAPQVRRAGADGGSDRRRVRRFALSRAKLWTALPMCGVLPVAGAHDRAAHARLSRRRPRRRRCRSGRTSSTAPRARRRRGRRPRTPWPTAPRKASLRAGSTRRTCTCTGQAARSWPATWCGGMTSMRSRARCCTASASDPATRNS